MPQLTLPSLDRARAVPVGVAEVGQPSGFTLQSSAHASATPILPSFLPKKPSPKEHMTVPQAPQAAQNPLARISKEIQLQSTSQNLYD